MLRHLLDDARRGGGIGTLGVLVGSEGEPRSTEAAASPRPGPSSCSACCARSYDRGVRTVAMETSSHALHQRRVDGLAFDAAVFTNLTRDHLDYHVTMDAYFAAKALLVSAARAPDGVAVVNADDPAWDALPLAPRRVTFGAPVGRADVRADAT